MKKIGVTTMSLLAIGSLAFAKEVTIAAIMPVTGAVAAYGQTAWEGVVLANKMVPTLKNGDTLKVVLLDTRGDKTETTTATSRAISQDKATGIIGELTTANTMQVMAVADKSGVPVIAPAATADKLLDKVKFGARVCFTDSFQGKAAAEFTTKNLGLKTAVVIIDQSQVYSLGLAKTFKGEFAKNGGKVLAELKISSGDKDFKAIISQLKAQNPDFVYVPIYHPEASLIARQAKQANFTKPLIGSDGVANPTFVELGGDAVNGFIFSDSFDYSNPPTELSKHFLDAYEKEKGTREIAGFTALGADAYLIMVEAMNQCENAEDRKCVNEKIHSSIKNFQGVSGIINIDENGNAIKSVVMKEIKDGKPTFKVNVNP
jgi:branched-chain amino-acid ABC transport system periplasmic binding protein